MIDSISFHENAESELLEASEYYELRVDGLGIAFISEVDRAIKLIRKNSRISTENSENSSQKSIMAFSV